MVEMNRTHDIPQQVHQLKVSKKFIQIRMNLISSGIYAAQDEIRELSDGPRQNEYCQKYKKTTRSRSYKNFQSKHGINVKYYSVISSGGKGKKRLRC